MTKPNKNEAVNIEPHIIIISPKQAEKIYNSKSLCPCHGDYKHKENKEKTKTRIKGF